MGTLPSCVSIFVEKYCVGGKRAKALWNYCVITILLWNWLGRNLKLSMEEEVVFSLWERPPFRLHSGLPMQFCIGFIIRMGEG